jgi:DNA mismatch repair ATPase MutL
VEILAAGRGLIRVTDDGVGHEPRRRAALSRTARHQQDHGAAGDLARITTLGFRGEAVPSIASVSRFTLTTRERQSSTGSPDRATRQRRPATQIVINGGRDSRSEGSRRPAGTTVEVRSLFFNVPARRKFLRSDETERGHIQHWLTTAALAHPHVGFTLTMEGRTVWQLPPLPRRHPPPPNSRPCGNASGCWSATDSPWFPSMRAASLECGPHRPRPMSPAPAEVSPRPGRHLGLDRRPRRLPRPPR